MNSCHGSGRPKTLKTRADRTDTTDLERPKKQRHTAKRIYDRLCAEKGFTGGYTTVKDYVRSHRQKAREMFIPLAHPAGHGQADFGEAVVVLGGVEQKVHFFAFDLPQSDACYI